MLGGDGAAELHGLLMHRMLERRARREQCSLIAGGLDRVVQIAVADMAERIRPGARESLADRSVRCVQELRDT
ncbi:hypothetical protein D3C83_118360 [compost metagenome]